MSRPRALLDTDTLSALMRGLPPVLAKAREYLAEHGAFSFSIITRYEILRGLKAKNAMVQLQAFDQFCTGSRVVPLTDDTVVRASEIYAELRRRGELIGDADILIAGSALVHDLAVVTNNEVHFSRISGLVVENWFS
ncbi:MAG TPA: type II toxin-antitoxin system VapC family toxin [Thermoanaerobaculia bacterium]